MSQRRIDGDHSGAKAMTTNQTIDGVSRELKLCPLCANNGRSDDCRECQGRVAWYSKPPNEAFTEWYSRNPYENLTNATSAWMAFKAGRDHAAAPQPQGEPVAELQVAFFEHGPMATINWFTPSAFEPGATKLYAEQPAPVAVVPARIFGMNLVVDGNMPDDEMHLVAGDGGTVKLVVNDGKAPSCCGSCPGGCVYGLKA